MQTTALLADLEQLLPEAVSDIIAGRLLDIAATAAASSDAFQDEFATLVRTPQLVSILGISRQAIHKAVHQGRIVAARRGREWLYPLWQVTATGTVIPGVEAVQARLYNRIDDNRALQWWTNPQAPLNQLCPARWLREGGQVAPVVTAAERFVTAAN